MSVVKDGLKPTNPYLNECPTTYSDVNRCPRDVGMKTVLDLWWTFYIMFSSPSLDNVGQLAGHFKGFHRMSCFAGIKFWWGEQGSWKYWSWQHAMSYRIAQWLILQISSEVWIELNLNLYEFGYPFWMSANGAEFVIATLIWKKLAVGLSSQYSFSSWWSLLSCQLLCCWMGGLDHLFTLNQPLNEEDFVHTYLTDQTEKSNMSLIIRTGVTLCWSQSVTLWWLCWWNIT